MTQHIDIIKNKLPEYRGERLTWVAATEYGEALVQCHLGEGGSYIWYTLPHTDEQCPFHSSEAVPLSDLLQLPCVESVAPENTIWKNQSN